MGSTNTTPRARRPHRTGTKILATLFVTGTIGMVAGAGTWSAFNDLSHNPSSSFEAGTVSLTDDDSGNAMFANLTGLKPGNSFTRCIVVTYDGSLPSKVRLHGSTGGTGLDAYLSLKVTRGTKSSGFSGCGDFNADGANYVSGEANGVIYNGTLAGWPDSFGAGITDLNSAGAESWTNGEAHAYRFEVTQLDNLAARTKTATQDFTWEAENE